MSPTTKLSLIRQRRIIFIVCPVLLTAIIFAALFLAASAPPKTMMYKGKTLDAWFYGSRKDFFVEPTIKAAQEAIDGLGTNAFPFLFYTLKHAQGNNAIYFKLYRAMPKVVQARIPSPLSGDDVRAITLMHISEMRSRPREVAAILADWVPGVDNPRLRMVGFNSILMMYQTDPAFLKLCRKLLNDVEPGIQLKAAIYLAQSAIVSDPSEPRLFPILLEALESSEQRKLSLNLNGYFYQQQPPGSPGPLALPPQFSQGLVQDPDEMLRSEILKALERLKPYLKEQQKERFKQARQIQSEMGAHD